MADYPWMKLWSSLVDDQKIIFIAKDLELPKAVVVGAWVTLLCRANASPIRGSLYVTLQKRYETLHVTNDLGLPQEQTEKILKSFEEYGLISYDDSGGIVINNFSKRNSASTSTERVRKYRAKKAKEKEEKEKERNVSVTFPSDSDSLSLINSKDGFDNNYSHERDAEIYLLYTNVSGNMVLPLKKDQQEFVEKTIDVILAKKGDDTKAYLQKFFDAWVERGYSKTNPAWLEWASSGEIPKKRASKAKNGVVIPEPVEVYE